MRTARAARRSGVARLHECLARLANRQERRRGRRQGGQVAGGGVLGWALNRSTVSFAAVDGGLPLVLAGAFAHQVLVPTVRRTATLPCGGWSSL